MNYCRIIFITFHVSNALLIQISCQFEAKLADERLQINRSRHVSVYSISGGAGSGKSSAMVKLALDWAKGNNRDTNQSGNHSPADILQKHFDYVFLVPLKQVNSDISLEQVLLQKHELENKNISEDEIKKIMNSLRSLLIFDGYDEYKKGTNTDIDAAISGQRGNSFVLITSRPDHYGKEGQKKT